MKRGFLALPAIALGLSVAPLASCDSSGTVLPLPDAAVAPALRTDPDAVHVVGTTFRDTQGRQLLFRGYNAKVTTLFDVTFDDGRVPEETFPDLSEAETSRIEELGWNVLRIPVSWSGLEPQPQAYAQAFLAKLDAVLAMAPEHGEDVSLLLQRADIAMYLAKEKRSGIELYSPSQDQNMQRKLVLGGQLAQATVVAASPRLRDPIEEPRGHV